MWNSHARKIAVALVHSINYPILNFNNVSNLIACLVSNFEQSLASMAQRLQSLTVSAAEKFE
ncbi:hypothetical protein ACTXT7_015171 [Hymenolepis weldensis]